MSKHEPRKCIVCGTVFVPARVDIVTCSNPECKKKRKRERQQVWYTDNYTRVLEDRRKRVEREREEYIIEEPHIRKPDTIVAIGYADRQKAKTLAMAGKVNTKL